MKSLYLLLLSLCLSISTFAQTASSTCNCCEGPYTQFDFWLGSWNVYDTTGTKIGENVIQALQDHCILQENWQSPNSTGSSYNYFNSQDSTWNQVWVDNQGNPLVLKGSFKDGKMVMRDELAPQVKGGATYNQISWEQQADGSVTQIWEVYNEKQKMVRLLFKGVYKKK